MFVKDWMSSPAITLDAGASLREALKFLESRHIRRAPVTDGVRLVGIVTKSDLMAVVGHGRRSRRGESNAVSDVMTRDPVTVPPDETIEAAAQLMLQRKISGLPVVAKDKVVGIVTESDLFRAFCEIMGVGKPGARITLSVHEDEDLLKTISRRLNGLAVRSLVTFHNARQRRWEIVLRVRGRVPARED